MPNQIDIIMFNKLHGTSKYKGGMQRTCGKWPLERIYSSKRVRMWLGTYNVTEEVSQYYDKETMKMNGPYSLTNF